MTTVETVPTIDGVPLTPKQTNLRLPQTFETVEEERAHRKQKLAGALRIFGRFGFSEGVAGHITVRDPEFPELFWVNPFGMNFKQIRASDRTQWGPWLQLLGFRVVVDVHGDVVEVVVPQKPVDDDD